MVDISSMEPLMGPWESDPWGKLRPPLSVEAVEMSALLAEDTYSMNVERWLKAGWRDVTIQIDGELTDGIEAAEGSTMQKLASAWKMYRVRQRIRKGNPLGQVMGAFRQKEKSDTGKALVMVHPAGLGRYVVAIGFMGTGERVQDWFSNFRLSSEGGIHQGYLQLTRQFEDNEEDIDFPETAQELGLEKLTLRHVLEEARHPNSRFTLWLCGHSQGAALIQVYAHRKIREKGVLPRNMVGYGFAAPSVMSGLAVDEPAAYPLYHIQNSEDVVSRLGAQVHLGMCLIYPTDEKLRQACYRWKTDEASVRSRQMAMPLIQSMRDTASCIEVSLAFMKILGEYTSEDMLEVLGAWGTQLPVKNVMAAADNRVDAVLKSAARSLATAYASINGRPPDQARVAHYQAKMQDIIRLTGLRCFSNAMLELINQPHRITRKGEKATISPYIYIAENCVEELIPAVWMSGRPPQLVAASRGVGGEVQPEQNELFNRRMLTPRRRVHRHLRARIPASRPDTRHRTPTLQPGAMKPGERIIHVE